MANFVDSCILVTGSVTGLKTFPRSHLTPDRRIGRREFDLGSFIPVPGILRKIEVSSEPDLALLALGAEPSHPSDML